MKRRYTAVLTSNGTPRIISVYANNKDNALSEIIEQLGKPGRESILAQWQRNGSRVIETTDVYGE